jgi:DNA-binding beta-propeller fold protein YncE
MHLPEAAPHPAPFLAPRRRRRGVLAGAAVIVAAGGVTAAVLAHPSHTSPTAGANSTTAIATLPEPNAFTPTGVAFESNGTLVTVDAGGGAFSWNIASGSPTPTGYQAASIRTAYAVPIAGAEGMQASGPANVVRVLNTATGEIIATLALPGATRAEAYALSPDGTEAAVADSDGATFVWKIGG